MANPLRGFAALAAENGDHARAVTLATAEETHRLPTVHHPYTTSRRGLAERIQRARDALGEAAAATEARGRAMTLDEAIAYALEPPVATTRPSPSQTTTPEAALSKRELEVARLVARGLTNRQIAAELVISERTASRHVEHILNKLGFHTRSQIATWVATRGR